MTREALIQLLENSDGHVTRAAHAAGIERQSMHRLLKRHGIEPQQYRPKGGRGLIARTALTQLKRHDARSRDLPATLEIRVVD
jgi:hypothetical protein